MTEATLALGDDGVLWDCSCCNRATIVLVDRRAAVTAVNVTWSRDAVIGRNPIIVQYDF